MLRNYQRRIASNAVTRNTLVMLPTGSGKTLIAAELKAGAPTFTQFYRDGTRYAIHLSIFGQREVRSETRPSVVVQSEERACLVGDRL